MKTRSPFLIVESKSAKKAFSRRWIEDMANLSHNGFRDYLQRIKRSSRTILGLGQLAVSIITYWRIILGQALYIINLSSDD